MNYHSLLNPIIRQAVEADAPAIELLYWQLVGHQADFSKMKLLSSIERIQAHKFFEHAGFTGFSKRGFVKYRSQFNVAESQ